MKILKSPQRVLILFLSVFLILSSIFIVRLEIKAASLQSQWEEHQKSLKANKDVLYSLDVFSRLVKKNAVKIDGNSVQIIAGQSLITLDNNNINIETKGDINVGSPTKSIIQIKKDGDVIIGPNNQKNLGYDKNEDFIYMLHNGARIILGEQKFTSGKKSKGMRLISKSGGKPTQVYIVEDGILLIAPSKQGDYRISIAPQKDYIKISKDESIIKLEKENIDIEAKGDIEIGPSDEKNFGYRKSEDYVYMINQDSRVLVGPLHRDGKFISNGIMLVSKTGGPQLFLSDKVVSLAIPGKELSLQINLDKEMIGMKQGQSSIKLEKNKLEIDVVGDINITSKNGNVNINGKKVNLNE